MKDRAQAGVRWWRTEQYATDRSLVSSKLSHRKCKPATWVARSSMSHQHSFLSGDPYSRQQAAEYMLNSAITQAKISETFEEYLEIFDKFYADEVEVSSETQQEPIRGKARVGSLLLNFLVPLHVM